MRSSILRLLTVAAALSLALGCTGKGGGQSYSVLVEAPREVKVGEVARTVVRLVPRGRYHVNIQYPFVLALRPTAGVEVAKLKLSAADGRVSEKEARFEVPFTPREAGPKSFEGEFKFSVCTEENCDIRQERISWSTTAR